LRTLDDDYKRDPTSEDSSGNEKDNLEQRFLRAKFEQEQGIKRGKRMIQATIRQQQENNGGSRRRQRQVDEDFLLSHQRTTTTVFAAAFYRDDRSGIRAVLLRALFQVVKEIRTGITDNIEWVGTELHNGAALRRKVFAQIATRSDATTSLLLQRVHLITETEWRDDVDKLPGEQINAARNDQSPVTVHEDVVLEVAQETTSNSYSDVAQKYTQVPDADLLLNLELGNLLSETAGGSALGLPPSQLFSRRDHLLAARDAAAQSLLSRAFFLPELIPAVEFPGDTPPDLVQQLLPTSAGRILHWWVLDVY
ncbi:unnamed protein product, partial [Amoebophrya sp. A120]